MTEQLPQIFPLPDPPKGRNYTRMCVAALRRHAEKMPTLSGVADHIEALDNDLGKWEASARSLHGSAHQLMEYVSSLNADLAHRDRQIEDLFEDFSQERDLLEGRAARSNEDIARLNERLSEMVVELECANSALEDGVQLDQQQKQVIGQLSAQLQSLKGYYEAILRDLDSTQARLEAQLASQEEQIYQLQEQLDEECEQHCNDVSAANSVIGQLREQLQQSNQALEALQSAQAVWNAQREAFTRRHGELEHKIVELVQDNSDVSELLTQTRNSLQEQVSRLQEQLENSQANEIHLGQMLEVAQSQAQQYSISLAQVQQQLSEVVSHRDYIQEQLNQAQQQNNSLVSTCARQQDTIAVLTQDLDRVQASEEELSTRAKSLEADMDEAMAWASELETMAKTTNEELVDLRTKVEQLNHLLSQRQAEYDEELASREQAHQHYVAQLSDRHIQDLAAQEEELLGQFHNKLSEQTSQYELQLFDAAEKLIDAHKELSDIRELMEFVSSEHMRAFSDLIDENQAKTQSLIDSYEAQVAQVNEQMAATKYQLEQATAQQAALGVELYSTQQALDEKEQQLVQASTTIENLRQALARAQDQLSRLSDIERELATVQETVYIQEHQLNKLEGFSLQIAALESGFDDSLPWDMRAWEGDRFIAVPGVEQWLANNNIDIADLGPHKFPGFTSADREHLAMCAGVSFEQFRKLSYVRPFVIALLDKYIQQGTSPSHSEGNWTAVGADGEVEMRWRTNALWNHLAEQTNTSNPAWEVYLSGNHVGLPQSV